MLKHVSEKPLSISEASLGIVSVSEQLECCIQKMLQKDPMYRFPSMGAVKQALLDTGGQWRESLNKTPSPRKTSDLKPLAIIGAALLLGVTIWQLVAYIQEKPVDSPMKTEISDSKWSNLQGSSHLMDDELLRKEVISNPQARALSFDQKSFTKNGLEPLKDAHALRALNIRDCSGLVDQSLAPLANLALERLVLSKNRDITSDCMTDLGHITTMRYLDLQETRIADSACTSIAKLPNLFHLALSGTLIGNAGVRDIAKMPALVELHLGDTNVSDITPLGKLHLKQLWLNRCKLDDSSLDALGQMHTLTTLSLDGTLISDSDLLKLKRLTNLMVLYIRECKNITPAGIANLHKFLPNCKITYEKVNRIANKRIKLTRILLP